MFDEGMTLTVTTRAQAIEAGDLVNVTRLAFPVGFTVPIAITNGVFEKVLGSPTDDAVTNSFLVFVLAQVRERGKMDGPIMEFRFRGSGTLWLHAGPGDRGSMVMTIMFPEEY